MLQEIEKRQNSMKMEELNRINPQLHIQDIHDASFQTYGRIIESDIEEAILYVEKSIHPQKTVSLYLASIKDIEELSSIQKLSVMIYGYMDVMAGIVTGCNHVLNGIEYHQGSETIIAVTDFVLIVGHIWDMKGHTYDSSLCELFYVPKGTIVECYSTTLHYTPVCVSNEGFCTICMLLKHTGDSIERQGILKKKNKWFIAHCDNKEKIASGDYPGLLGEMIKINY